MPTYGGVDITGDCWGADAAMLGALTDEQLAKMFAEKLPNGEYIEFVWGYCPLPGNVSRWDLTGSRMRALADMQNGAGNYVKVLFVQHCRGGSWVANAEEGAADGKHAADYVTAQGYPQDCHLAVDDE